MFVFGEAAEARLLLHCCDKDDDDEDDDDEGHRLTPPLLFGSSGFPAQSLLSSSLFLSSSETL